MAHLSTPVSRDAPCPVLQYADDTLIILKGEEQQIRALKEILLSPQQLAFILTLTKAPSCLFALTMIVPAPLHQSLGAPSPHFRNPTWVCRSLLPNFLLRIFSL